LLYLFNMAGSNGVPQANGKASNLPDSRSPTLILTHPTEAEKVRQFTLNGASWRGALSLEAYLRREIHLASQEATHNGGISFWALVDKADLDTRRVLCACETYRKRAVVASKGTVQVSVVHGIGSVFCPPEFRGRGYAGRMMEMLGAQLSNWQATEGCPFSVLFSDIGKVSLCV
jgi:GNAT superfamily N-acetyltransferase